jgi:hypothetical protein
MPQPHQYQYDQDNRQQEGSLVVGFGRMCRWDLLGVVQAGAQPANCHSLAAWSDSEPSSSVTDGETRAAPRQVHSQSRDQIHTLKESESHVASCRLRRWA